MADPFSPFPDFKDLTQEQVKIVRQGDGIYIS